MKIHRRREFDREFHEAVRAAILATHEILIRAELAMPEMREYLNGIVIKPSYRMRGSAGIAHYRTNSISLNARLLKMHPEHLLETLVHEVCHLIEWKQRGIASHGSAWKALMVRCGYLPRTYHKMDAAVLRPPEKEEAPSLDEGAVPY